MIVVISDLHGTSRFFKDLPKSDLLLICGDITHFGGYQDAREILGSVKSKVFAVHGNCDRKDVLRFLEEKGISLHKNLVRFQGYKFFGFGGGNKSPFNTPTEYSEEEFEKGLRNIECDFLVAHTPPKNTKLDEVFLKRHIGSKALRKFVEDKKPIACFCGHVHEARGYDYINETLVLNPGKFSEGYYALFDFKTKKFELERV